MQDGKYVVLCVDDEADVRQGLRMVLEPSGYLVEEANGVDAAVAKFREAEPDFILVDMMMERVDSGLTVAAKLKELGNTAPVYLLSSITDGLTENADPASCGFDGVFQKPVDPSRLLTSLRARLGG